MRNQMTGARRAFMQPPVGCRLRHPHGPSPESKDLRAMVLMA